MPVIQGTAMWASVLIPNTKYDPVYSVSLIVDNDTAKKFKREGYNIKQFDQGPAIVFKRKVTKKSGEKNAIPKLFDAYKNEIDVVVGNGSTVKVQYSPWETTNNYGFHKGLDLQAVQVLKLVESSDDGAEFKTEDVLTEDLAEDL